MYKKNGGIFRSQDKIRMKDLRNGITTTKNNRYDSIISKRNLPLKCSVQRLRVKKKKNG